MITRVNTIGIELTPRELEREFWDMNSIEQTDFLLAFAQRYINDNYHMCMQFEYIADEMSKELSKGEYETIVETLQTFCNTLNKGEKEWK